MSVICRTFVQNTWRSDLCSNCFKSLEDHVDPGSNKRNSVCDKLSLPRYVPQAPSLYQSRGISTSLKWRLNESLYDRVARRDFASQTLPNGKMNSQHHPGIADLRDEQDIGNRGILIKSSSVEKRFRSRGSVDFADEEAMVIGYGGNDYDSDTSPWEMGSDDGSIDLDLLDDTDEDRKISRLTKNNTEFNSFNKNLLTGDDSSRRVKAEEEKLNSVNNNNHNNNNSGKPSDKSISILTYNDIQSTKKEKKLNQYFFPSPTEALKSYLNSHVSSMIIDDSVIKNNNELCQKIHNSQREVEKKGNSNVVLKDDFTPLNTQTYTFVSELNKNVSNLEQNSDSDYSTCRHTTSDSTDSESFHDAEEAKAALKTSFLHGTYTNHSRLNDLDGEKKYDAGSSTSGDISNFSDDSDTHDSTDGPDYKRQNDAISTAPENKVQRQGDEQNKAHTKPSKSDDKSKTARTTDLQPSPPSTKHVGPPSAVTDKRNKVQNECNVNLKRGSSSKSSALSGSSPDLLSSAKASEKTNSVSSLKSNTVPEAKPHVSEKSNKAPECTENKPIKQNSPESETKFCESNSSNVLTNNSASHALREDGSDESQHGGNNSVGDESRILDEREFGDYEENSDNDKSPEAINNRQSKLAALALELELARKDSERKSGKHSQTMIAPPEPKTRYSLPNPPSIPSPPDSSSYPTIKKATAISCVNRLSTLPDVLQETPAKQKKSRFSLKKLLKRNKDSGTFSPANKEVNPKAWKKQTFDRNRLSLEIVHPMDLTSDVPTSADSTPTEEHKQIVSTHPGRSMFKGVSSRARSLSALPQLSGDEHSGVALLECRKMDTIPARKAGTVAERKKTRPSLVRTPSCSALPNRTIPAALQGSDRAPPPKPPPPPKCKAMHPPPPPPPPHSHPRCSKPSTNSPARPPPPKVPDMKTRSHSSSSSSQELREQNNSDKEYANLGDIRSLLTPKKPQRPSAFSGSSRDGEMEKKEDMYETLPPTQEEEEDHYTYLDEVKSYKATEAKKTELVSAPKPNTESIPCVRPWLDLQTSYAAIAATNYESLAELITASQNEGVQHFKKMESSLKWKDFQLETQHQHRSIGDRAIYNAVCKNEMQDRVTLVVAPKKYTTPQNVRNHTRFPVLASFTDHVPRNSVGADNYVLQDTEMAAIYVLQQSVATTVKDFAKVSSMDDSNQSIHLRNYCFVLLQLIHTLKSLQAEGIEEINYDLEILVLVVTEEDKPPVLVLFPEDKVQLTLTDFSASRKTLCQATLETMLHFLQIHEIEDLKECLVNGELLAEPVAHTFKAIAKVLSEEKASSLSQAKGFLEYMLWGPVDVKVSQSDTEEVLDTILQRWLDLQRAQMVKSTISHLQNKKNSNAIFHVYEEYQLVFLLQASVKSLKNVISKL